MEHYSREQTPEQIEHGKNTRIRRERDAFSVSERLDISKAKRILQKLHAVIKKREAEREAEREKQEAERIKRELAGLPPLLPPPPVAKPTKEKKSRTKNPEAPPPKPSRTSSAPKQRTAYANAELERTMRASALFAHNRVDNWQQEALAKSAKAQTIAAQLAAAVVDERKSLATTHTDKGEETLRAKSEAAYKAEARAQSLKASASKFVGVVPRARANFTEELTKSRNEIYAEQERRDNEHIVINFGRQIFASALKHQEHATSYSLSKKWSLISNEAMNLKISNNKDDTSAIIELLGTARNAIEQTSANDEVGADKIIGWIAQAKSIKKASDEALKLRNKAGFKRTKKHRKKRRKTRNNRTNKFVAQKH
jgi:hypothetical protein